MLFATHHALRQRLILATSRFPPPDACRNDLLLTAWMAIAEAHYGLTDDYYFRLGCLYAERWYRIKYIVKCRRYIKVETERKRAYRRRRFYLKVRREVVGQE